MNSKNENLAMLCDFYEFTMANCLFLHGFKDTTLVFDMFFRKNPDNMGYSISAGQRKLTRFLLNYHFNEQDIRWLRTKGMSEEFCEYLRTYQWKGDMYALPEGTVAYPHVQMVRIECDLVGAILIETYLLQTMNFHSLIATKATRVTGLNTHTPRSVMEFGTRRAQGESAGNDGAYAAVLGGCVGTANCLAEMKFGAEVKAVGTVAHSFIEFFPTEFDAFKAFADTYPDSVSLLLDTYNIMESGLPNLIKLDDYLIEKYPNDPNRRVKSARIDSGDLARGSKRLRKALDAAGKKVGVNFVGGYTALVHKGFSAGDRRLIESIPPALAETDIVCSSVNIGATKAGLNMDAVKLMGEAVKKASELTADRQCIGAAKLVVFCNAPEDNPFMAGAFHGPGEPDCEIHVGVSGPGAVRAALARLPKDAPIDEVAELVKRTAFKITRVGQLVANLASKALGVPAGIIDLSLAPTPAIGDSVANILEEMGLETCGCCGTTACLALLNDAVKKGGVMASNHVGGLSGAFIPVSEDAGMIHAAEIGCLTIEKLEAMTAVCSVGIDMVIIPGDTTPAVISALIADEAAIGMVNSKTTAVRIIPVEGKDVGDMVELGGLLGSAPVMPVHEAASTDFIARGGRIPAPLQSLKN